MKVGILAPASKVYPAIGFEFMNGLRSGLSHKNLISEVEFIVESIGFGGVEKEVYTQAERLLLIEGVDVLLAYVDLKVLDLVQPLFYASNRLIILINPGANYLLNWVPQPNVIHLNLLQSYCCWLTGELAAHQEVKKAANASTFYDCGYLHGAAMVKAYVSCGGEITYNYINNQSYNNEFSVKELTDYLVSNDETKNLLCQFDSLPASMLFERLNASPGAKGCNVFASPMMLKPQAAGQGMENFEFQVYGHTIWDEELQTSENILLKEVTKSNPSIFTLLGWDAASVLARIFESGSTGYGDGSEIVNTLKQSKFESPRGEMYLDPDTHYFLSEPILFTYTPGKSKFEKVIQTDFVASWKRFVNEPTQGPITSWTNTYLCY